MTENAKLGPTPLHRAAYAGHANVCKLLLEHGANPMAVDPDGDTALHLAIMSDDIDTCRVILTHGKYDLTIANNAGQTATDVAQECGDEDIVAALIAAGAPKPTNLPLLARLPLVSDDARFLTFSDIPEPIDWLSAQITELHTQIRIKPGDLSLRWAPMEFWPGGYVLAMRNTRRKGPSEQFALVWPNEDFALLDWTNEPIYTQAERRSPLFDDANAMLWCRFFFHFVRGQLGRFRIVERVEDVIWTDDADDEAKQKVHQHLALLKVLERPSDDRVVLQAPVVFKNALFRTKILLATRRTDIEAEDGSGIESFSRGQSRLFGEELLLEELPVHVDKPPTRFG